MRIQAASPDLRAGDGGKDGKDKGMRVKIKSDVDVLFKGKVFTAGQLVNARKLPNGRYIVKSEMGEHNLPADVIQEIAQGADDGIIIAGKILKTQKEQK